jgi:hypothetical protein
MALGTSGGLLYVSPLLEDARHILVIQNLVAGGGEVLSLVQWESWLMPKPNAELQLDYFEVTGKTVQGEDLRPTCKQLSPRPALQGGLREAQHAFHPEAYTPGASDFSQASSLVWF